MFVGSVDLKNGTQLELVIVPLKGSTLRGQWEISTNLVMICVMNNSRCCVCAPDDFPSRFEEKLGLAHDDAKRLAQWLKDTFTE
jgi:hypothetical protein